MPAALALRLRTLVMLYAAIVAAAPIAALVLEATTEHEERLDRLETDARDQAIDTAALQQDAITDVTRTLGVLAEVPAVVSSDRAACAEVLRTVASTRPDLEAMWSVSEQDDVRCSSRGVLQTLRDWPPMQEFRATPDRVIAGYAVDPVSGDPVLPVAARSTTRPGHMMVAAVNLDVLQRQIDELAGRGNARILLVDPTGVHIASNGSAPATAELLDRANEGGSWRAAEDGTDRLYVAVPIDPEAGPRAGTIIVGMPTAELAAAARADLAVQVAVVIIVIGLAGIVAAVMAHRVFEAPTTRLVAAVRRFGEGDLDVVVPPAGPAAELQELRQALERMTGTIARMERARRGLLNHVAHQLRTPLTSLVLQTHVAAKALERDEPERARRAVAALAAPLSDLRQKSAKLDLLGELMLTSSPPVTATRPAGVVVDRACEALDADVRRSGLDVPVHMDTHLVGIGLVELLENALDASDDVEVAAVRRDDGTLLQVRAVGASIDPGRQEDLLGGTWTWEGDHHGLGLGLLIAWHVARAHGGRLEGGQDGGAWFGLWLPDAVKP